MKHIDITPYTLNWVIYPINQVIHRLIEHGFTKVKLKHPHLWIKNPNNTYYGIANGIEYMLVNDGLIVGIYCSEPEQTITFSLDDPVSLYFAKAYLDYARTLFAIDHFMPNNLMECDKVIHDVVESIKRKYPIRYRITKWYYQRKINQIIRKEEL